jgi:hypothetical protein
VRGMAGVTRGSGCSLEGNAVRILRVVGVGLVVAAALVLSGCGMAARAESLHTLRAAEAAFYRAGLPFEVEWTPNPYLRANGPPFAGLVPKALLAHLTGSAEGANPVKFTEWMVFIFDQPARALAFGRLPAGEHVLVIRADNVVHFGTRLPAAMRAMSQLRHG